jgi:hypothetical protein
MSILENISIFYQYISHIIVFIMLTYSLSSKIDRKNISSLFVEVKLFSLSSFEICVTECRQTYKREKCVKRKTICINGIICGKLMYYSVLIYLGCYTDILNILIPYAFYPNCESKNRWLLLVFYNEHIYLLYVLSTTKNRYFHWFKWVYLKTFLFSINTFII